jgi:hypothetical protein
MDHRVSDVRRNWRRVDESQGTSSNGWGGSEKPETSVLEVSDGGWAAVNVLEDGRRKGKETQESRLPVHCIALRIISRLVCANGLFVEAVVQVSKRETEGIEYRTQCENAIR